MVYRCGQVTWLRCSPVAAAGPVTPLTGLHRRHTTARSMPQRSVRRLAAGGIFQVPMASHIGDQEGGEATMATYRLADILKSISDLSDDEIERMNESEAWQWIRTNTSAGERGDETQGDCEHR